MPGNEKADKIARAILQLHPKPPQMERLSYVMKVQNVNKY